jgi:hypothetical protein
MNLGNFKVVCNDSNNSKEDIENNILNVDLTIPIEIFGFIINGEYTEYVYSYNKCIGYIENALYPYYWGA